MKAELRSIIAGVACAWLLAGCGGGASNGENSSDSDDGGAPRTFLQVNAATIPDDALRTCVNRLAQDHEWLEQGDVDAIVCGDVEIRSIQGLQQFPGLRELRIAAPRLPVSEIPLLASLPLDDYKRKPFYRLNDESLADNAEPGMKQLLMDGDVSVVSDQAITYVVLLADDPRNPDRLHWAAGFQTEYSPTQTGSQRVGEYVTLHWLRVGGDDAGQYSAQPLYGQGNDRMLGFDMVHPRQVHADQPIEQVSFSSGNFRDCVLENATQHGWITTWQVTTLNCANRNIGLVDELESFPKLEYVDFRGNPAIASTRLVSEQTDATVIVADTALDAPLVEIRECGLYIANFDPAAQYGVWKVESEPALKVGIAYDWMRMTFDAWEMLGGVLRPPEAWQPGSSAQCMSIEGRGAGAWVVEVNKDGVYAGAELFPVTNEQGEWVQYLVDDRALEPLIFLPGLAGQSLYVLKAGTDRYEVQQLDSANWARKAMHQVDRLPYLVTDEGVYLFPARGKDAWQRRDGAVLRASGVIEELPPRPVAGRPHEVFEAGGEIWLTGIKDDWGARPEILVWNPRTQQWRTELEIASSRYSAYLAGDAFCAQRREDVRGVCWNATAQAWMPEPVEFVAPDYHRVGDFRYLISGDDMGLYAVVRLFFGGEMPVIFADGKDPWEYKSRAMHGLLDLVLDVPSPWLLLMGRHIDSAETVLAEPIHFGLPLRVHLKREGNHLLATYNDSVVRYPLPAEMR
jgi:hypothetical protein